MARILVVDDEPDLCEILCFNLESEGFEAERAYSAEAALQMLEQGASFDLILLDVMMERMSGIDMARHLRSTGVDIPIIFLTARTAEDDQLDGFAAGGDDYVTKPFSFPTVLARIRAVLKRASTTSNNDMLSFGQLTVDVKSKTVAIDGVQVSLTKKEYNILILLLQNQGQHFSRQQIMDSVWDDDTFVGDRSVDVHVARLRKKLGSCGEYIVNHTGFGYTLQLQK
jgi:DNA-binding response OmpR family regulator